jgi:hypothetical protein
VTKSIDTACLSYSAANLVLLAPRYPRSNVSVFMFTLLSEYRLVPMLDVERPSCSVPGPVPCVLVPLNACNRILGLVFFQTTVRRNMCHTQSPGSTLSIVQPNNLSSFRISKRPPINHAARVMRTEEHEVTISFCMSSSRIPTVLEVASLPCSSNAVSPCASGSCMPTRACTGVTGLSVTCYYVHGPPSNEPSGTSPIATQRQRRLSTLWPKLRRVPSSRVDGTAALLLGPTGCLLRLMTRRCPVLMVLNAYGFAIANHRLLLPCLDIPLCSDPADAPLDTVFDRQSFMACCPSSLWPVCLFTDASHVCVMTLISVEVVALALTLLALWSGTERAPALKERIPCHACRIKPYMRHHHRLHCILICLVASKLLPSTYTIPLLFVAGLLPLPYHHAYPFNLTLLWHVLWPAHGSL